MGGTLAVGLLLLAGYCHHRWWLFVCDDAYIALRYAQNFAQSGSPVYNLGGSGSQGAEWVEGYTSPLWVFVLAGLSRLGVPLVPAALTLCALGSVSCLWGSAKLATCLTQAEDVRNPGIESVANATKGAQISSRPHASTLNEEPARRPEDSQRISPPSAAQTSEQSSNIDSMQAGITGNNAPSKTSPSASGLAPFSALWCVAFLVATPEFVVWASGGLESSCATALGLAACLFYHRRQMGRFHFAAAVASLARLDTLLWIAAFVLPSMFLRGKAGQKGSEVGVDRRVSLFGFASLHRLWWLMPLAHLLWRRRYYGAWLPHTWAVKRHGASLAADWGLGYVWAWGSLSWLSLVLLWVLGVTCLGRKARDPGLWGAWCLVFANIAYAIAVGGDFMAYSRFLLPSTCVLAALGGCAAGKSLRWGRGFGPYGTAGSKTYIFWIVAVLVGAMPFLQSLRIPARVEQDRAHAWLSAPGAQAIRAALRSLQSKADPPAKEATLKEKTAPPIRPHAFESVSAMERFAALRIAAGHHFAQRYPASTVVTVGAAGAFPFASGFRAYDLYGLVDPVVLEKGRSLSPGQARPGHTWVGDGRWQKRRKAALRCEIGWAGTRAPQDRDLRQRVGRGRGYEWECVETGPVRLRTRETGPLPSHFYCCLR